MPVKKILIVEDESSIRKALNDKLQRVGDWQILEAGDGEAGLATALQEHPEIILLDIIMPKMDGLTMLSKLREDAWGKTVPVLVLTNVAPNEEAVMSKVANTEPSYYFVKANKSIEEIVETVKDIVGQHSN